MNVATQTEPVALSVRGLRKAYKDVVAVDGLDLEVRTGECFGLLGPNGAGKTTTIEICEGLTEADAGDVEVLGRRWRDRPADIRERIGISLQETQLSEKLTVAETIRLFRSFYRSGRPIDDTIDVVQLAEKRDARVGALSGGQRQRLALACALVGDPDLLFLDEPTTGLDPLSRRQLWEVVEQFRSTGRSIVLTTHYMEEAERLCDRVAVVDHGHMIALGTPQELIRSLGAEHVVEFAVDPTTHDASHDALDPAMFGALDGVENARADDGAYRLQVTELHLALPALMRTLQARGAALTELRTRSATLEDVFISLTGRKLGDD